MRHHAIRFLGFGWVGLAIVGFSPIGSVAQTDSTTSWSFERVWFRGEKRPGLVKAFAASGQLTVSATGLTFRADKHDLDIAIAAVREVSMGHMKGDGYNDWVIVTYDEQGMSRVAGFRDGNGMLGGGPNTVAIHDAIRRASSRTTPSQEASTAPESTHSASAGGVERLTRKEFDQQIKQGFPPAPNTLVTDPNTLGLLVVDGDVKAGLYSFDMDGIGLARAGEEGLFRAGPAGLLSGCVLFTGLEPGEYVVKIARGSSGQGWAALEAPDSPDLVIRIEAGKVHYLGQLHLKTKKVEKKVDPARETKVWARFAKKYAGTSWATLAEERSRADQGR